MCDFYAFTIKADLRNKSENWKFRQKDRIKPSQSTYFAPFKKKKMEKKNYIY